jgi:hypothetical protein
MLQKSYISATDKITSTFMSRPAFISPSETLDFREKYGLLLYR